MMRLLYISGPFSSPDNLHGIERNILAEYATIPPPGATFMLDNGAFTAWKHGEEWDEKAFYRMLTRFHAAGLHPYGVVIPDIVKGGLASLKRSEEHLPLIPEEMPRYLAVQEGITPQDVLPFIPSIDGIFVGTPGAWKWRKARQPSMRGEDE
ncbi:hypothetical protein J2129_002736 [Methanofollis sp. W23]|uniref:hypothetical protein n=1 Tax=Methanofollis sp. W23 TaxID=2817849 RepID=UPI001AE97FBC|nr:hypothetical protein [Methanofollis sp. W23]MBP2147223.1 hypothetical protein [Methanofollis sp. W23]